MLRLRIYERTIKVRTGYRKYPFKNETQYIVCYGAKTVLKNHHYEDYGNPRLKVPFTQPLETRSKKRVEDYIAKLGRTDAEKWLKSVLTEIISKED